MYALASGQRLTLQEIAIRIFRTAHELGLQTVAIYSYEDRMCGHRYKVCSAKTMAPMRDGHSPLTEIGRLCV